MRELRELFVSSSETFVVPELSAALRRSVEAVLGSAEDEAVRELVVQVGRTGADWGYHTGNTLARRINSSLGALTLEPASKIDLSFDPAELRERKVVYLANHLSFSDANVFSYLLGREGHSELADRLCVLAGPKVYSDVFRRFSSLSFGSIKIPQSPDRATGEAVMERREVARLARGAIEITQARLAAGDHLLVFLEGTRSRTAEMQPGLAAVSRYLDVDDLWLVPLGIWGSERLMPIGDERARRTEVSLSAGPPVQLGPLKTACEGKRSTLIHAAGLLVAEQLPPSYRGFYASADPSLDEARAALALNSGGGPSAS